jgi:hypothetical protein
MTLDRGPRTPLGSLVEGTVDLCRHGGRMHLVVPDILQEARELPVVLLLSALAVGLFLWLLGGRNHRFWLALALTLAAGLCGLRFGQSYGMQPLVAGLLLAVSTGALALSLIRILLFGSGGCLAVLLLHSTFPDWDETAACFLVGGLVSVLLYKFWVVVLSSLVGTLLLSYSGLCLLARFGKINTVAWAEKNGPLLDWCLATLAVLGLMAQFLLERRRQRKKNAPPAPQAAPAPPPPPAPPAPPPVWWKRILRRAG